MSIYRVTFTTELLVEAEDYHKAIKIGQDSLEDEVRNGTSEFLNVEQVKYQESLRGKEINSYPWRYRSENKKQELTVNQILPKKNQT